MNKFTKWWDSKRNNNDVLGQKAFDGWKGLIKLLPIIMLASADVFSMAAPYYMWNVFPDLPEKLNISQGQLLFLTSAVGASTLISQLPGGWLADKISSKKMLISSLFMTGSLMIIWSLMPFWGGYDSNNDGINDSVLYMMSFYLIYIGWGISTTLLFWTPLWKLLSQQAEKDDQGNVYGLQGMINGTIGFFLVYLLGFGAIQITAEVAGVQVGFSIYSLFLSLMLFGTGFGVWAWIKEKPTSEKFSLDLTTMKKVAKNYKLWLMAFFVMGIYVMQQGLTKMMPYMSANLMIAIWLVSLVGAFRTYVARMAISSPAGKFGDRRRSYIEVLLYCLGIAIILLALAIVLPGFNNSFTTKSESYQLFVKIAIILIMITLGFLCWTMVTLRYTQIIEVETPKNSYASVVAFISFIAFSTDAWLNPILGHVANTHLLDDESGYATQTGNQIILGILLIVAIFGFICGFILWTINKHEYKKYHLSSYRKELNNSLDGEENKELLNKDNYLIKDLEQQPFLAHRGLSALYPENTRIAFRKAYENGYVGIETDVHLTKDQKLVICHDEDILRTSSGSGKIKDLTLKELREYDFAVKFKKSHISNIDPKKENDFEKETILTLEEFLEEFYDKFEIINLEIKTDIYLYPTIEEKLLKTIDKYRKDNDKFLLSSFNLDTILKLRKLDKKIKLGYLIWEKEKFKEEDVDFELVHNTCQYINIWDKLYLNPKDKKILDKFKLPYVIWYSNSKRNYNLKIKEKETMLANADDVIMQIGDYSFKIW